MKLLLLILFLPCFLNAQENHLVTPGCPTPGNFYKHKKVKKGGAGMVDIYAGYRYSKFQNNSVLFENDKGAKIPYSECTNDSATLFLPIINYMYLGKSNIIWINGKRNVFNYTMYFYNRK